MTISANTKFKFNNEVINLEHNLFDVVVFDSEKGVIKEIVTPEELLEAKVAKADYLLDTKQITLYSEPTDVEVVETKVETKKK